MQQISTTQPLRRLASLDFMRGVIMVLLMLESTELYIRLSNVTTENTISSHIIGQFFHNHWTGLHFWDIIQPAFMFMAGVAMAYSGNKQDELGVAWNIRFHKIAKRCGWLIFWGLLKRITAPDWFSLQAIDVTDILTQLAFATMIAFLVSQWKAKYQLILCIAILVVTEFIYRFLWIPDLIEGYTDGKNIGSYIDWILFGQAHNHYVFINWLPTAVHTIAGLIVGNLLIKNQRPLAKMTLTALILLIVGYGLDISGLTPIIKPIATSSFVMASLGYCLLILVVFYWWIDVKNHKNHLLFFRIVGMNSIFIYLFCDIVGRNWLNSYATILLGPIEHSLGFSRSLFLICCAIIVFIFEWYICRFLYQKKIFFKI